MKLNKDNKISILMQHENIAVNQLMEIKRNEMNWLKVFLLFYSAIIAWMVSRWFSTPVLKEIPFHKMQGEFTLLESTLWFSLTATLIFTFLFIQTRHSYYGVAKRLHNVQVNLELYNDAQWGGKSLLTGDNKIGIIEDFKTWKTRTKPFSSFSTRLIYLLGANFAIAFISYRAYESLGYAQNIFYLLKWIFLNLVILITLFLWDYFHFRGQ